MVFGAPVSRYLAQALNLLVDRHRCTEKLAKMYLLGVWTTLTPG